MFWAGNIRKNMKNFIWKFSVFGGKTMRMRRLIWAFAVRIIPKTRFRMAQPMSSLSCMTCATLIFFFFFFFFVESGPRCFDCQRIPYPRDCDRIKICGDHEVSSRCQDVLLRVLGDNCVKTKNKQQKKKKTKKKNKNKKKTTKVTAIKWHHSVGTTR